VRFQEGVVGKDVFPLELLMMIGPDDDTDSMLALVKSVVNVRDSATRQLAMVVTFRSHKRFPNSGNSMCQRSEGSTDAMFIWREVEDLNFKHSENPETVMTNPGRPYV
jgi:hypothetical protein